MMGTFPRLTEFALVLLFAAAPGPVLAQTTPDDTGHELAVSYLNVNGQMHGFGVQWNRDVTPHFGFFAEFDGAFGPDCAGCRPVYHDYTGVGGARFNWWLTGRVAVFLEAGAGLLASTSEEYSYEQRLSDGRTVTVTNPKTSIASLAFQPGGGVTVMLTPRFGLRGKVTAQLGVPDQSEWEGITLFRQASLGGVVRLGGPANLARVGSRGGVRPGARRRSTRARWDVAATANNYTNEAARFRDVAYELSGGYYWTSHLKTDARFMLPVRGGGTDYETFPVAGLPDGGYATTFVNIDLKTASAGMTYQFFENARLHPYVSAGAQIDQIHERRHRPARTGVGYVGAFPGTAIRYPVSALDEQSSQTRVRPYVGAGVKIYVMRWLFAKGEALVGASRIYGVGVGVDF